MPQYTSQDFVEPQDKKQQEIEKALKYLEEEALQSKDDAKLPKSILQRATDIVENRSEEKERQYGPFSQSMNKAAEIASSITDRKYDYNDVYAIMIGLKMSRISHSFNTKNTLPDNDDSMLDTLSYIGAWQNHFNETKQNK